MFRIKESNALNNSFAWHLSWRNSGTTSLLATMLTIVTKSTFAKALISLKVIGFNLYAITCGFFNKDYSRETVPEVAKAKSDDLMAKSFSRESVTR